MKIHQNFGIPGFSIGYTISRKTFYRVVVTSAIFTEKAGLLFLFRKRQTFLGLS